MKTFSDIRALATRHHPDLEARLAAHAGPKSPDELRAIPDDRWLAQMTRCVFQAGFVWKVIEAKWDGFEAAFEGFDPNRISFFSDDDIARLVSDARIVRNGQKIMATVENARMVADLSAEHGGFGNFMADWPSHDQAGLLAVLKSRGSRLSGMTAQYFLRFSGWDAWILSADVGAALVREGVVDKAPTSKAAIAKSASAIAEWAKEGACSQSEVSRVLALSVG
ncbi:DNA-3-methyladenine glycosylase I [uncultured Maricaulis sp.]|uniref:DNA-3-methyladenine glycosylase I n=1 Tax=uncultured Maricaulis sp. TaxID=174710 RepID=UPI0026223B3E|nr:DNA-3-methyladenine glycosylase I [uncultured Maricaulis sp.]